MHSGDTRSFEKIMSDFALALEGARDVDAAMDCLSEVATKIDFPMIDYSYLPVCRLRNGEWAPPPVKTRGFPANWDIHWHRHRANDAYYHACFGKEPWVDWAAVRKHAALSDSELDAIHYLEDKQLVSGVTIPIHLSGGRFAFVSGVWNNVSARRENTVEVSARLLSVIAHYFHNTVSAKFGSPFQSSIKVLSPRELECLTWLAKGKTAEETSRIIDRSVETVRVHLKNSILKMGAANCAHAAAKAVFLGLIDL